MVSNLEGLSWFQILKACEFGQFFIFFFKIPPCPAKKADIVFDFKKVDIFSAHHFRFLHFISWETAMRNGRGSRRKSGNIRRNAVSKGLSWSFCRSIKLTERSRRC
jgi:hypothetical protein